MGAVFEYDADADALYYRLTDKPVKGTTAIGNRVNVDYDEDGEAVGIEVISPPGFSVSIAPKPGPVVHACPFDGEQVTPCCRKTPFDLPRTDKITVDHKLVTCRGAAT